MMKQKRTHNDYLAVLKSRANGTTHYISILELSAGPKADYSSLAGRMSIISRKIVRHEAVSGLHPHYRSGRPRSRVAVVNFIIKGNVAEMDVYHREHQTPHSSKLRLDTLAAVATDLKKMGCDSVLTRVFIPGRNGDAGSCEPALMKIDDWAAYLKVYRSPSEFAGQALL